MSVEERLKLLSTTAFTGFASIALLAAAPAYAQDADDDVDEIEEIAEEEDEEEDRIVITGSRLGRDTFTSASPVQVIQGQVARESGLFDVQDILQSTPQVTGSQIDQTFGGFVLDQGPGSQEVNFRGLGAGRTLVLLNSKRVAPAGVEGAPGAPDISLIPSILIGRIENLLDGASSVYGSDAVAGVTNIILRDDLDGLRFEGNFTQPEESGGESYSLSAAWGVEGVNGRVTFAAEYQRQSNLEFQDRDFLRCNEELEQGESGQIRSLNISREPGIPVQPCKFSFYNRIFLEDGILASLYRSPDGVTTNVGIPGYLESSLGNNAAFVLDPSIIIPDNVNLDDANIGGNIDGDGDGLIDVNFFDPFYNTELNPVRQQADFLPTNERFNFYSFGEYDLNRWGNMTAYFEAGYSRRETFIDSGSLGVSPSYPANSPFNPCNTDLDDNGTPDDPSDDYRQNPNGAECYAVFGLPSDFLGSNPTVVPQVQIRGLNEQTVNLAQTRIVGGLRGDLPFLDVGQMSGWTYDVYAMRSQSDGTSIRPAINNDRLILSTETSRRLPDGSVVCGIDVDGDGFPDGSDIDGDGAADSPLTTEETFSACVPVNLFAPGKFGLGGGSLSPEEYDYLVSNRIFNTVFEQTVVAGFASGTLARLPWNDNDILFGVGFEYREDRLDSSPDFTSGQGQQFRFFTDPGASGARDLYEFFAETSFDVFEGRPFAELLQIEGSVRFTEESFAGSATTYSVKGLYKPTEWLTLRGTYGTSFRAPNAREQFLNETSGFTGITDPCVVPEGARIAPTTIGGTETYDPTLDTRDPDILAICVDTGADPTSLGLAGGDDSVYTIEAISGGSQDLDPETSRSFTYGVVLEPFQAIEEYTGVTWLDRAGLQLSATYYDILIEDSITELGSGNVVGQCYTLDGSSTCGRISRDALGFISTIDTSPVN
ncbi:MAG: TonB-dependent receptor, partial [Pseudomonadota bacterium]